MILSVVPKMWSSTTQSRMTEDPGWKVRFPGLIPDLQMGTFQRSRSLRSWPAPKERFSFTHQSFTILPAWIAAFKTRHSKEADAVPRYWKAALGFILLVATGGRVALKTEWVCPRLPFSSIFLEACLHTPCRRKLVSAWPQVSEDASCLGQTSCPVLV